MTAWRRWGVRLSRKIFASAGIALILGAQLVFVVILARPDGARIRSPQESFTVDRAFVAAGDAWKKSGAVRIEVIASSRGPAASGALSFAASPDQVKYRGAPLFALSTWSARVELPADGRWELQAVVHGADGTETRSAHRTVLAVAGTPVREFRSWKPEHLVPLALILVLAVVLGLMARRPGAYDTVALAVSLALWLNESAYQLYWFMVDGWAAPTALMIQMCGLSILFLPLAHFATKPRLRQFLFDVLYFWGIGGALQALIAPDIGTNGFPAYRYFSFFVSHGLIIASTVVLAAAGGMRITLRSFLRAIVVTNLLLLPMYGLDQLLRLLPPYDPGNYFVLGYPPPTGSLVDLFSDIFGPSPRYVIGLELMGAAVFGILYLPWLLTRRRATQPRTASPASRSSR